MLTKDKRSLLSWLRGTSSCGELAELYLRGFTGPCAALIGLSGAETGAELSYGHTKQRPLKARVTGEGASQLARGVVCPPNPELKPLLGAVQVLFGLLTGTENQYSSRSSALSSQEQHNILPLASSQIR